MSTTEIVISQAAAKAELARRKANHDRVAKGLAKKAAGKGAMAQAAMNTLRPALKAILAGEVTTSAPAKVAPAKKAPAKVAPKAPTTDKGIAWAQANELGLVERSPEFWNAYKAIRASQRAAYAA